VKILAARGEIESGSFLPYDAVGGVATHSNSFATEPLARDVDGAARVSSAKGADAVVDIGAYELQGDAPGMVMSVR